MKLTQQLRALGEGDYLAIEPKLQTAAYVTAKRIGIQIRTEKHEDLIRIYRVRNGVNIATVEDVISVVKTLSDADRLAVFDAFELCCGMNRRECICEIENVAIVEPALKCDEVIPAASVVAPAGMNNAMAQFLAKLETKPIASPEPVEEVWQFTREPVEYHESGDVFRRQYPLSNPKLRRVVQVDMDNQNDIIRIVK